MVVSDADAVMRDGYFELYTLVPLTQGIGSGLFCPAIATPTQKNADSISKALVAQIRTVDPARILRAVGSISSADLSKIEDAMKALLLAQ